MAKLKLPRILLKRKKIIQLHSMIHYDFYTCISRAGLEKNWLKLSILLLTKVVLTILSELSFYSSKITGHLSCLININPMVYCTLVNLTYIMQDLSGAVTLHRVIERMSNVWNIRTTFEGSNPSIRRRSGIEACITECVAYTSVWVTYA